MNNLSPTLTAGAVLAGVDITPLVQWALTGFHGAMPDSVPGVISAIIVYTVHQGVLALRARSASPEVSPTPAVPLPASSTPEAAAAAARAQVQS